jgi:translation initiation factor RLI1
MDSTHYNILSTLLNTTYAKASSPSGTQSVKAEFAGNNLVLKFTSVVHFAEEASLKLQVDRLAQESVQLLADLLKKLKADFKEASGETLKVKELKSTDGVELISGLSLRKVAYYRRNHTLQISV